MDRARIHEGIGRMRCTDVLGRSERSELSQMEAAELLGISERTFRRWSTRCSWSIRRARRPACVAWVRSWRSMACSVRSVPTGAVIFFTPEGRRASVAHGSDAGRSRFEAAWH